MTTQRPQLLTLKRLLAQANLILSSESLDMNLAVRCRELLAAANTPVGDLLKQDRLPAAAVLRAKGGTQTAKRGSEYFRQLAAKRKLARAVDPAKTLDSCRIKSLTKTEAWRDGRESRRAAGHPQRRPLLAWAQGCVCRNLNPQRVANPSAPQSVCRNLNPQRFAYPSAPQSMAQ